MATGVFIFEDNDQLRESLSSILQLNERYNVVGDGNNVLDIEDQLKTAHPDLILMDIDMPGMTGIEAVKKIRAAGLETPILMLTVFDDNEHVFDAIRSGATGYLLKKHIASRLFSALDEMLTGGAPMSPSIARMVINSMQSKPSQKDLYNLTAREKEILGSLSKGNSYKLIAAEFDISIDTVRTHIKNIYEKLRVHSQTEAVSKALKEKLF